MRLLARGRHSGFSYPIAPKLILLEQPWLLARDDWGAEDPCRPRHMLRELLDYTSQMGIPVFSTHSSRHEFEMENGFEAKHGIRHADISNVTKHGFLLEGASVKGSFLDVLVGAGSGPVVVGGAHARFSDSTVFGKLLSSIGLQDMRLDGLCIRGPLEFLLSLRDSGLIGMDVYLDPRITLQLVGTRMDESRLYEVVGMDVESSTFSVRPSARL